MKKSSMRVRSSRPALYGIVFKSKSSAKSYYKKMRKIDAKRARSTFFPEAIAKNSSNEYVLPFRTNEKVLRRLK